MAESPASADAMILAPVSAMPKYAAEKLSEVLHLKASDVVYELGCNDGRALIACCKHARCKGVGIDIHAPGLEKARANALIGGVSHLTEFRCEDALAADLAGATVILLYLLPRGLDLLRGQLERLPAGTRVASYIFEVPFWANSSSSRPRSADPSGGGPGPQPATRGHLIGTTVLDKSASVSDGKPRQQYSKLHVYEVRAGAGDGVSSCAAAAAAADASVCGSSAQAGDTSVAPARTDATVDEEGRGEEGTAAAAGGRPWDTQEWRVFRGVDAGDASLRQRGAGERPTCNAPRGARGTLSIGGSEFASSAGALSECGDGEEPWEGLPSGSAPEDGLSDVPPPADAPSDGNASAQEDCWLDIARDESSGASVIAAGTCGADGGGLCSNGSSYWSARSDGSGAGAWYLPSCARLSQWLSGGWLWVPEVALCTIFLSVLAVQAEGVIRGAGTRGR